MTTVLNLFPTKIETPPTISPSKPRETKPRTKRSLTDLLNSFLTGGNYRVHGAFRIDGNKLMHWNDYEQKTTIIAVRVSKTLAVGNAAILKYVECSSAWGSYHHNRSETKVQRLMQSLGFAMLPFNVFEEAKLELSSLRVIEKAAPETVKVKISEWDYRKNEDVIKVQDRHFVGASVFAIGNNYFLFDIDRREVDEKIFNPFLVKLPRAVKTVKDAYTSLKPKEVLKAEKQKKKVLRQGEWFFIPCATPKVKKPSDVALMASMLPAELTEWDRERLTKDQIAAWERCRKFGDLVARPSQLQAGQNRPNEAQEVLQVGKTVYVRGKITHTGREHADLVLQKWHIAVPNTATTSWTIVGEID